MRQKLLFLFYILSTITYSQKKDKRDGNYSLELISVEAPNLIELGTIDSLTSTYEDALIKINWKYAVSQLGFDLTNKSDESIKVIWDDAAFISTTNESSRIFHKGVKYIDRENSQAPTTVYKSTTLSDLVSPTTYTKYVSGKYGGWSSKPLIQVPKPGWSSKVEYKPELLEKTVRVALPIKKGEELYEYMFEFKTVFIENEKK